MAQQLCASWVLLLALLVLGGGLKTEKHWGTQTEEDEVKEIVPRLLPELSKFGGNARFDAALLSLVPREGRHAYVISGTDPDYALAGCTVAKQLRRLGKDPAIEVIGLHGGRDDTSAVMRACGEFDRIEQTNLQSERKPFGYYSDIAVKFAPFGENNFTHYDRLVLLDADVQPLKNLDFLFYVPEEFKVFTPRAYWIGPEVGTGALYGIKPDPELRQSLLQMWNSPSDHGEYPAGEMDVVNSFFSEPAHRSSLGLLPANFLVLDSHWHLQEERQPPQPNTYPSGSLDHVYVVHFTGYQKPWYHTEEDDLAHFTEPYRGVRRRWWADHAELKAKVTAASKSQDPE